MFAFAHMLKFLSNKLSSLRRRSFTFLAVTSRAFNYFFLWHRNTLLTKMRLNAIRRTGNKVSQAERRRNQEHSSRFAKLL